MRIDELITAVRLAGRLDDNDTDYTSARIRQELTNTLHTVFGHAIVLAKAGAWLKQLDITAESGRTRYRIPYRACAGIGESVELLSTAGNYQILGDQIVFDTAPAAGVTLRWTFYVRPSLLVEEQASAGRVTAVDTDALTVTVASVPTNRVTAATVASGDTVDIVHANGWHELSLFGHSTNAPTLSSTTFTFPSGTDLTDVEVGDFVRAADQTDWPCIPDDFHEVLADMTASRINRAKGNKERAKMLAEDALGELERFKDILQPRMKDAREVIVPSYGILRGSGARWPTSTSS